MNHLQIFEELFPNELFGDVEKKHVVEYSMLPYTGTKRIVKSEKSDIYYYSEFPQENMKLEMIKSEKPKPKNMKLDVLFEQSKREVFHLYRWNAWLKISEYSIGSFLQPYLFERSVKVAASSGHQMVKITSMFCRVLKC